jgi:hypothetical protein
VLSAWPIDRSEHAPRRRAEATRNSGARKALADLSSCAPASTTRISSSPSSSARANAWSIRRSPAWGTRTSSSACSVRVLQSNASTVEKWMTGTTGLPVGTILRAGPAPRTRSCGAIR